MKSNNEIKKQSILLIGDVLTLGLVTVFGFATHGEATSAGARMLTTFLPLVAAWLLVSPHLGAFDLQKAKAPRSLWRPFWAMVLAGPFAAWLRGVWLNAAILPVFVVVLGGVSALGILLWRILFWLFTSRSNRAAG